MLTNLWGVCFVELWVFGVRLVALNVLGICVCRLVSCDSAGACG